MSKQWQDSKRQVSRQIVNLVNPRLALYTRAGFLAAIILAINFAIVACLALMLQRDCTGSTIVDRSSPVTFGDFLTYEEFINKTLGREGVVREDTTTTTTTVSGCVKRNSAVVVAPYMSSLCTDTCMQGRYASDGDCDDGGPGSEYNFDEESDTQLTRTSSCPFGTDCTDCGVRVPPLSYSGTGITSDVPCWNMYLPCFQSTSPSSSPSTASPPPPHLHPHRLHPRPPHLHLHRPHPRPPQPVPATLATTAATAILAATATTAAPATLAITAAPATLAITAALRRGIKLRQSVEQRLDVHGRQSRAVHLLHNKPDPMCYLSPRADQLPVLVRRMPEHLHGDVQLCLRRLLRRWRTRS